MSAPKTNYVSTWSIAILSAAGCWFGWLDNNNQVILASLTGFIAFVTFLLSPTASIRSK